MDKKSEDTYSVYMWIMVAIAAAGIVASIWMY